jgi:hypothetical protein
MKPILNLLGWAGLAAGLVLIVGSMRDEPPQPRATPTVTALVEPSPTPEVPFARFPIDEARSVHLDVDEDVVEQLTPRERLDQTRDWLLYTVAAASGLAADELNRSLHDLPAVRHGYMRHVASFDYGPTRSCSLGGGRVVAVIPSGPPARREADLCEIADGQRKNLGSPPTTLVVFEYEIDPDGRGARLTRRADRDGPSLFRPEQGYFEAKVRSLDDLSSFMGGIDDVTFARVEPEGLVLGGRKVGDRPYRGVGVEDVAAIWQAERAIHQRLAKFESETKAKVDAFNSRWAGRTYRGAAQGQSLKAEHDAEWEALEGEVIGERMRLGLVNGSGFSLDPTHDFEGLGRYVEGLEGELARLSSPVNPNVPAGEIAGARSAIERGDWGPLLNLAARLRSSPGTVEKTMAGMFDIWAEQTRISGELDFGGMAARLAPAARDLDEARRGARAGITAEDFRAIREAASRGDVGPMLNQAGLLGRGDSAIDRALAARLRAILAARQGRRIVDTSGMARWLASMQADLASDGPGGPADLASAIGSALDQAAKGDPSRWRSLGLRLSTSGGPLARAVGAAILESRSVEGPVNDIGGSARDARDLQADLTAMAELDRAASDPEGLLRSIRALERGDEAPVRELLAGVASSRTRLSMAIGGEIEQAAGRFRERATAALVADLVECEARSHELGGDVDPAGLSEAVAALEKKDFAPFEALMARLLDSPDPLCRAYGGVLWQEVRRFRRPESAKMAALLSRFAESIAAYASGDRAILSPAGLHRAGEALAGRPLPELSVASDPLAGLFGVLPPQALEGLNPESREMLRQPRKSAGPKKRSSRLERIGPLFEWIEGLQKSGDLFATILGHQIERGVKKYAFQAARYDGDLKGTEVGMVLFYTDLLAKLWALDFLDNQPGRLIDDFKSMTSVEVSPIYAKEEQALSNTRLWFGHEDRGFQVAEGGRSLILGRVATRIYAASSTSLRPGEESAANATSEAFLGWWNDHYGEVARYEPEYERLNEIMKWSLLISWLNEDNRGELLGFLDPVAVDHSRWFADWAGARPELRFRRWDRIGFYPAGYRGSTTESLPLLRSDTYLKFGGPFALAGGVSLAPKELFKARAALSEGVESALRRPNINYATATEGGLAFKTFQETRFALKSSTGRAAGLEAVPKAGTKLRGRMCEMLDAKFERALSRESGSLTVDTRVGGKDLAGLRVAEEPGGFRVGVEARELDTMQVLARRASRGGDPLSNLARHPEVESATRVGADVYLVRLKGSPTWYKLGGEGGPAAGPGTGRLARIADMKPGSRTYELANLDEAAAKAELVKGEAIRIEWSGTGSDGVKIDLTARGPPATAEAIEVRAGEATFPGKLDRSTGAVYLDRSSLPGPLAEDPGRLHGLLARSKGGPGRGPIGSVEGRAATRLTLDEGRSTADRFAREVGEGRFGELADEISRAPDASRARMNADLRDGLGRCEQLAEARMYAKATFELELLEQAHGPLPDIRLRKAVVEIRAGRTADALDPLNRGLEGRLRDPSKFYEEVNARLGNPDIDPAVRRDLGRATEASLWRDLQVDGRVPPGKIEAYVDGDGLNLAIRRGEPIAGKPASLRKAIDGKAPIYVQDAPGLNHLDWGISTERSLQEVLSGDLGIVVEVPDGGIARFSPTRVYSGTKAAPELAVKFDLVRPTGHSWSSPGVPNLARSVGSGGTGDDDDEEERRLAYFVIAKAARP